MPGEIRAFDFVTALASQMRQQSASGANVQKRSAGRVLSDEIQIFADLAMD